MKCCSGAGVVGVEWGEVGSGRGRACNGSGVHQIGESSVGFGGSGARLCFGEIIIIQEAQCSVACLPRAAGAHRGIDTGAIQPEVTSPCRIHPAETGPSPGCGGAGKGVRPCGRAAPSGEGQPTGPRPRHACRCGVRGRSTNKGHRFPRGIVRPGNFLHTQTACAQHQTNCAGWGRHVTTARRPARQRRSQVGNSARQPAVW